MYKSAFCALLMVGASCDSGVTNAPSPTCSDGLKNGTETDIDCGGSCGPCATGKSCAAATDCIVNFCLSGVCSSPTCSDTVKNGGETDIDCGGTCEVCAVGKGCTLAKDCTSGVCQASVCAAPSCTDAVKHGAETDIDCGGTCGGCGLGKVCRQGSDCGAGTVCDATVKVCRVPTSCSELLQSRPGTPDGSYMIAPQGVTTPFGVVCDMTRDGGGWTLALKANGDATLAYTSALWTDMNLLNQNDLTTQPANAKYMSFLTIPVSKLRGELDGYTFTSTPNANMPANMLFAGPAVGTMPYSVAIGTGANWSVQPNCQYFGINTPYAYQRARYGWTANQEGDCSSNDTAIGLGLGQTTAASQDRGAGYACLSSGCSKGNINTGGNGLLWVQ